MHDSPTPAFPADADSPTARDPEKRVDDSPLSEVVSGSTERSEEDVVPSEAWIPEAGHDVIGSCGHKIGEIVERQPDHIVVEVGFFNPTDLYIPTGAIAGHHRDHVLLSVSKDEALHRGWEHDPLDPD